MTKVKPLPPPVETLLVYAAYGMTAEQRRLSFAGKPRLLERTEWAPMLARILEGMDGLARLSALAETGMRAWGVHASLLVCVKPAFASAGMREHLAELLPPSLVETPTAPGARNDPANTSSPNKPRSVPTARPCTP